MSKQHESDSLKWCNRGDKYTHEREMEVAKNYVDTVKHGSNKDVALMLGDIVHNGSLAESVLLNIYDVLKHNHDDSTDGLKGQQWFIKMMISVYMEVLNKDKDNHSLVAFYKRGDELK